MLIVLQKYIIYACRSKWYSGRFFLQELDFRYFYPYILRYISLKKLFMLTHGISLGRLLGCLFNLLGKTFTEGAKCNRNLCII